MSYYGPNPVPPNAGSQLLCPNCQGGNPFDAAVCMWCRQPIDRARVMQPYQQGGQPTVHIQPYQHPPQYPQQYPQPQQHPQQYPQAYQPQQVAQGGYPQPAQYPYPYPQQTHTHMNVTVNSAPAPLPMAPMVVMAPQKSVAVAILLTFFFGPLGMFYSTVVGAIIMLIVNMVLAFVAVALTDLMTWPLCITWPICIIWGAVAAASSNKRTVVARY